MSSVSNGGFWFFWVVVWGAIGLLVTPIVYKGKGRSGLAGAFFGAVLGAIGGLLFLAPLWILTPALGKRCPRCGKNVREEAAFCNHCGYQFPAPYVRLPSNAAALAGVVIVIGSVAIAIGFFAMPWFYYDMTGYDFATRETEELIDILDAGDADFLEPDDYSFLTLWLLPVLAFLEFLSGVSILIRRRFSRGRGAAELIANLLCLAPYVWVQSDSGPGIDFVESGFWASLIGSGVIIVALLVGIVTAGRPTYYAPAPAGPGPAAPPYARPSSTPPPPPEKPEGPTPW